MKYRLRYLPTASGYLGTFAGKWAGQPSEDRAWLEDLRRQCPNGEQLEIVEVDE